MKLLPSSPLGALAAVPLLLPVSVLAREEAPPAAAAATLRSCLTAAGVANTVEADGAAAWTAETALFNWRFSPEPACIAAPKTRDQLALSLSCARNASVKATARGAGHSFAGYGYGQPGGLVVSMAEFQDTSFDAKTNQLTFGGGARVGPVAKALWDEHGRHFPHVRGSHVGLTGSSFGGGFGTTSRMWGTPIDNIVSAELMLYNGTVVTAAPGSDLLFAVKGAAPSYGVVLSMTTRTFAPAFPTALNFTIRLGDDVGADAAARGLMALQEFALRDDNADGRLDGLAARWRLDGSPYRIDGYWYGDPAAFDSVVGQPLTAALDRAVANNANTTATTAVLRKTELPFWDVEVAACGNGMNQPGGGDIGGHPFYTQALTTTLDHPLTFSQVRTLISNTGVASFNGRTAHDLAGFGYMDLWGGASARDKDLTDDATAFPHARNLWLIRSDGQAAVAPQSRAPGKQGFTDDEITFLKSQLQPFERALTEASVPLRGFVNYPDTQLKMEDWSSRLYGNNFEKLRKIKAAYDPEGLFFSHAQSIPLP